VPDNAFLKNRSTNTFGQQNKVAIDDPSACSPSQMTGNLQGKGVN